MSRKVFISLLAAALLVAAAVAPAAAAPPTKVGIAYDVSGLGDGAFNDLVHDGALEAKADFGIKLFEMQQVKKNGMVLEPATVINKLAKKSDLVVGVGFLLGDAAEQAALADSGTNFAVIDTVFIAPPDNLLGATPAANEGSFLVGAAAALESNTGSVGFISGIPFAAVQQFEAGYVAGVSAIDPVATVDVVYSGTFSDPSVVYPIAMDMYNSGIDVIYNGAGGAGFGIFEAAFDYTDATGDHVWAIGVDVDQYQTVPPELRPHILTSMVKNFDVMAYDIIASQVNGTFVGGNELWDLSRNGIDYATSGGFVDDYVPTLEALRAAIIDGTINVPSVP